MSLKENELIEFKKTTSELKQGLLSISAMLNKNGKGTLYFGIKNDGSIFPLQIGKDTLRKISREINNHIKPLISPTIEIVKINNIDVIKVFVNGHETPYSAYGRYYLRSADEDYEMTSVQLENVFKNKDLTYSKWENTLTDYGIDEIDENTLINFINKANEANRINYIYKDPEDALIKLGLMKNKKLNNAGYYLFSKNKPLMIKKAIYASELKITFIDNEIFKGNILECIEDAVKYISKSINWNAKIIGFERYEKPEIPIEAIREIVVNSFVHMKVSNNSSYHQIEISPNTVKIYNPGELINDKDPKDFAKGLIASQIRNPLIALSLYKVKLIEAFGSGFRRVFNLCDKENINYDYFNNGFGFNFIFERKNLDFLKEEPTFKYNNLDDFLTRNELKVFNFIKEKGRANTIKEINDNLNLSRATIQRALQKMVSLKLIKRIGSNKTGHWKLN